MTVTPVNDAPVVTAPVALDPIAEDSGARLITQADLLANASDADGPSLSAVNLAIASGSGALADNGDGTWSYTPALNDDTSVSFSYAVTDGIAAPVATSATLDVTPVNHAPVANADTNALDAVVVVGAGSITTYPNLSLPSAASGAGSFAIAGASISGLGDVNGDGLGDLLISGVGAYYGDPSATAVVFGNADGVFNPADTATKFFEGTGGYLIHDFSNYFAGRPISGLGDVNGDGHRDLLIGGAGAPFVMFGGAEGEYMEPDVSGFPGFTIVGETGDSAHLGPRITSVSSLGDFNGDGYADLVVTAEWFYIGSHWLGLDGAAYVVFGKAGNTAVHLDDIANGIGGFKIVGEEFGQGDGVSVSGVGDVNGDGLADLLVGMPNADGMKELELRE